MAPKLILIGGSLATGKSSLARLLEERTRMNRISMDDLKEQLFDIGGSRDRAWSKQIGRLAWPVFQGLVEMHLARGESVIADATFLWPGDREWVEEIRQRYDVELLLLWMTVDPRMARERFIRRANTERHPGHCDALEQVIEEFDGRFFSQSFAPLVIKGKTKIVDTTDFATVDHDEILKWISEKDRE